MKSASFLAVALLLLMFVPTAFSDFNENFDEYPYGTVSPGPWTQYKSPVADPCFVGSEVTGSYPALSPPQSYNFSYTHDAPGCNTGVSHTLTLNLTARVSSIYITLDYYAYKDGSSEATVNFVSRVNATTYGVFEDSLTTSYTRCGFSYTQVCVAGIETPGSTIDVSFALIVPSGILTNFAIHVDNIFLKGADAVVSGANLFLFDFSTRQWFNISGFPDSRLVINYSGVTPAYILSDFTTPDLNVPLTGATLVTVYLGSLYFRSVIPTSTTNQVMWLDDPNSQPVSTYTIQVLDFSRNYPAGTEISLRIGTDVIASGYLDSNHVFTAGLVAGPYQVKLVHGLSVFVSSVNLAPNSPFSVQITVSSISIDFPQEAQTAISCLGFLNSTHTGVVLLYRDRTNTTSAVTIDLWNRDAVGPTLLSTNPFTSGPYGNITITVSGVPVSDSQTLYVACLITNTFSGGTPFWFPSSTGQPVLGGVSGQANLPDVLYVHQFLPNVGKNGTETLAGLGVLTIVAGAFGEFFGPIGAVVVGIFTGFLSAGGWIPVPMTMGLVFTLIAIAGILIWLERRNR